MKSLLLLFIAFNAYALENPIYIANLKDAIIEKNSISNSFGDCMVLINPVNVTVKSMVISGCAGRAIKILGGHHVTISKNLIQDMCQGIYVQGAGEGNVISRNKLKRVHKCTPTTLSNNLIQLNGVIGAGNKVIDNFINGIPGESDSEDNISIYNSSGTELSPILVSGNCINGASTSPSGGGIITGEGGHSAYVDIVNNTVINPGGYGLAIAGGVKQKIMFNSVYQAPGNPISRNGIVVWNQTLTSCNNNYLVGNNVDFTATLPLVYKAPIWDAGNCTSTYKLLPYDYKSSQAALICPTF